MPQQSIGWQNIWKGRTREALTGSSHSLVLPLSGIALGLLVAGFGAFREAPHAVTAVPPGYVALVNQKGILTSDFVNETESVTKGKFEEATAEERRQVLRSMIDEELLVQRGLVLDIPETTVEVREAMTQAVNAQVDAPLQEIQPTDAQLLAYYNEHLKTYTSGGTMTVRDLLLRFGGYQDTDQSESQARSDATDAVYQLRSGASVDYVMEHFGFVDSGRVDNGMELEFAAKIHLRDKLYAVATTLADGEISDPIVDTDGVHVLIMSQRQPPSVAPFSSVRSRVYDDYRKTQDTRAEADNLRILRSQAKILLAPGQSE